MAYDKNERREKTGDQAGKLTLVVGSVIALGVLGAALLIADTPSSSTPDVVPVDTQPQTTSPTPPPSTPTSESPRSVESLLKEGIFNRVQKEIERVAEDALEDADLDTDVRDQIRNEIQRELENAQQQLDAAKEDATKEVSPPSDPTPSETVEEKPASPTEPRAVRWPTIQHRPQRPGETIPLERFDTLTSLALVDMEVTLGKLPSRAVVHCGKNATIRVVQKDGEVTTYGGPAANYKGPCWIAIQTQSLSQIFLKGRGNIDVWGESANLKEVSNWAVGTIRVQLSIQGAEPFAAKLYGTGALHLREVRRPKVTLDIHGRGDIRVYRGEVEVAELKVYGQGTLDAAGVDASRASLNMYGTGAINTFVRNDVEARVTGRGQITISGNPPKRAVHARSADQIEFRE